MIIAGVSAVAVIGSIGFFVCKKSDPPEPDIDAFMDKYLNEDIFGDA